MQPNSGIMMNFTSIFYGDLYKDQEVEMIDYIKNNNLSLISYTSVDVSDVSLENDSVSEFKFERTDEAMLFRLKFPNRKGG